jgi:hypothetical protein
MPKSCEQPTLEETYGLQYATQSCSSITAYKVNMEESCFVLSPRVELMRIGRRPVATTDQPRTETSREVNSGPVLLAAQP